MRVGGHHVGQGIICDPDIRAEPEQRLAAAMLRDALEEARYTTGRGKLARRWLASEAPAVYLGLLIHDEGEIDRTLRRLRHLGLKG